VTIPKKQPLSYNTVMLKNTWTWKILMMLIWYAVWGLLILFYSRYLAAPWFVAIPLALFTPMLIYSMVLIPFLVMRSTIFRARCPNCMERGLSIGTVMLLEATRLNEHRDDFYEKANDAGISEKRIRVHVSLCKFCKKEVHKYRDGEFDIIDSSDRESVHRKS
jgi:uncharacterized membrane protein (DUF485 family)